jgi:hypothetical protein
MRPPSQRSNGVIEMKRHILMILVGVAVAAPAISQSSHYVQGYTTKNGTFVAPHYQSNPDSSRLNNWSTKGNVNPYTGKVGTVDPYSQPKSTTSTYGSPLYGNNDQSEDDPQ